MQRNSSAMIALTAIAIVAVTGAGMWLAQDRAPKTGAPASNEQVAAPAAPEPADEPAGQPEKPAEPPKEVINSTGLPLTLPPGFGISYFAKGLGKARVMAWDPSGTLLVSVTDSGKVLALPDKDGDLKSDETITVISGLNQPHGLAFRCRDKCQLYIAETNRVGLYDYDQERKKATFIKTIAELPSGGGHFTRTLLFMPSPDEDRLLVAVGSSCNVCVESDQRRAKIMVVPADGGELKEFARGLRNSVFMAIHPVNGKIWATDMGRDLLGDDIPPDEVNIVEEGRNYGWPNCYGKNVHDDKFDRNTYIRNPCMEPFETPSHIDLQAHSAPLGLAFVPEEGWDEDLWHDLLVAYHGSWNRSTPTGYKIVRMRLDANGKYAGTADFITGWIRPNGAVIGRPVDLLVQPGGTIYISDDKAGVIYRVSR